MPQQDRDGSSDVPLNGRADRGGRGGPDRRRHAHEPHRKIPIFRLLAYYALLSALGALLIYVFPPLRDALVAPLGSPGASGLQGTLDASMAEAFEQRLGLMHRTATTAVVIFGALLLTLPVAWVYTFSRRLRYDRSLVHSLIILPPVVAGTVMVVKNSLALAFSLAGIVAAVRFRTTLKDPKDAVHVFLVIAVGLAAGVQALDIALILSLVFNLVVLALWKYDLDTIYAEDTAELLSVGDSTLFIADTPEGRREARKRLKGEAEEVDTDGFLLVHTMEPEPARQVAEVVLSELAKEWRFHEPTRGRNGVYTLEAAVRLRKKKSPVDLLAELEDRWAPTVAAAEYVPYTPPDEDES